MMGQNRRIHNAENAMRGQTEMVLYKINRLMYAVLTALQKAHL